VTGCHSQRHDAEKKGAKQGLPFLFYPAKPTNLLPDRLRRIFFFRVFFTFSDKFSMKNLCFIIFLLPSLLWAQSPREEANQPNRGAEFTIGDEQVSSEESSDDAFQDGSLNRRCRQPKFSCGE
jgi:hypothetical protein